MSLPTKPQLLVSFWYSFNERLNAASKHLISYLDAENMPVIGTTYFHLSQMISRISDVLTSNKPISNVVGECLCTLLLFQ